MVGAPHAVAVAPVPALGVRLRPDVRPRHAVAVRFADSAAPLGGQRCPVGAARVMCMPRHGYADAVGQLPQESQVAWGELAHLGAPALQHLEYLLTVSMNRHADQTADAMSDCGVRHLDAAACQEMAEVDGLVGMPSEALP